MSEDLERLYQDARSALKTMDYDRASDSLRQILLIDENYKDASRLLAQTVKLRRRRWYNDPRVWGTVGAIGVIAVFIWIFSKLPADFAFVPNHPTASPSITLLPIDSMTPTGTPEPTPTQVPFVWKRVSLGSEFARDTVTAIIIDPKDPEVIYAGMQNAGIYKSIDGGTSWQPALQGLSRSHISSMIMDPEQTETLYAGLIAGGVYRTTDGGRTWQPVNQGIELPGGAYLATVAMDPIDSTHLYFTDSLALYETRDGGENWTKLQMPACPKLITSLVIPPSAPNTIYIADRERSDQCPLGIYRSKDGGKSWDILPINLGNDLQLSYGAMVAASEPQETIFISGSLEGDEKLYRSIDEGKIWEIILAHRCFALQLDPIENGKVYCGGAENLSASSDWGKTWKVILKDTQIQEVAVSPRLSGTLFAGAEGSGLFVTSDGGTSWVERDSGLGGTSTALVFNPYNSSLYAEVGAKLYRSMNSGQAWDFLTDTGGELAFSKPGSRMYTRANTIMVSEDNGKTWKATAATNQRISSFMVHPQLSNMLIAVHESGFSVSLDSGKNWDQQNNIVWADQTRNIVGQIHTRLFSDQVGELFYILINGETSGILLHLNGMTGDWGPCPLPKRLTTISGLSIDPRDRSHIIISSPGNGLLISVDGCETWTLSNNGLGSLFVNSIAIDPNQPDSVYVGTDGGAYFSSDAGQNWGQVNGGLLGATVVYSIVVDQDSNVYAATPYGIFNLER